MDYWNSSSRGSAPPASLQHHHEPSRDVVPAMVYYMPNTTTQNRNPRDIIRTTSSQNARKVVIHRFRTDKFRQSNESESDYVTVAEFTQHMVMESLIDCILPICSEATRKKKADVVRLVFGDRHETLVRMVDPADSAVDLLSDIPSIGVELCMLPSSADDYSGCLPTLTESDPIWDHAYLAATTTNSRSLSDAIFFIRTKDNAPIRRLTSSKNHHAAMTRAMRVWTSPDDPMRLVRIETLDEEYASTGDESPKKKMNCSPSKKRSRAKPTTTTKTMTTGTPMAPRAFPPKSPSEDIPKAQVLVMDNEEKPAKKQQKEPLVWKPVMKKWDAPPRGIIQLDFTRDEMDMLAYHYEHDGGGTTTMNNGDKKKAAAAKEDHDAAESSAAAADNKASSPKKKKKKDNKKKSSDDKETETAAKKDADSSVSVAPAVAAASPRKKKKKSADDEDDTSKAAEKANSAAHVDTSAASASPKKNKSSPARKSLDSTNKSHKEKVAGKSIVVPGSKKDDKEPEAKPASDKKNKKKKRSDSESSKSSLKEDEQSDSSDSSSISSSSSESD